jgi:hypothetical protein
VLGWGSKSSVQDENSCRLPSCAMYECGLRVSNCMVLYHVVGSNNYGPSYRLLMGKGVDDEAWGTKTREGRDATSVVTSLYDGSNKCGLKHRHICCCIPPPNFTNGKTV